MLTRKQSELLHFIAQRVLESGVPPSFDEMKDALDLRSKSGIHRLIIALEERGFIRRLANRARALEILKLPEGTGQGPEQRGFVPSVIEGGKAQAPLRAVPITPAVHDVPLLGRIAAGSPISAIEASGRSIGVPRDLLGAGDHFALEVNGESMIEEGILDSDVVIVRRQDTAEAGDIVVALIDDAEATLKRLQRRKGMIELEAANPAYKTQVYSPDRVRIQGRLVSLIRRY